MSALQSSVGTIKETPANGTPLFRRRKFWIAASLSVLALLFVVLGGTSWYYAGEIHSGAFAVEHNEPTFKLEIIDISDSSITLIKAEGNPRLDDPGTLGLLGQDGDYGRVGEILNETDEQIVRFYEPFDGVLAVGDRVKYERSAFPDDPMRAYNLEFTEVPVSTPLGDMPAWFVSGSPDTWAVMVHGRGASQEETLRAFAIAHEAGLSVRSISYRNDEGVAADPSGDFQYGITEWEDLEAAVEYALKQGAEDVVLFGFSMGGAIVSNFMIESIYSDRITGVVLDAPLLNLDSALDLAASQRGVPEPIPSIAAWISTMRWGVDWGELDTRDELVEMDQPILLFHGTGDQTIPVSQSDSFSDRGGSNVTYIRVDDAEHVGSWNIDPARYRTEILNWLQDQEILE
jgi:alpha-beta hydrolase superfamily lysophospholipase